MFDFCCFENEEEEEEGIIILIKHASLICMMYTYK